MSRQWRAAAMLMLTLALASACHNGAATSNAGGPGSTPAVRTDNGAPNSGPATVDGGDSAFCAVAKAKGAANLDSLSDSSADLDPKLLLANLDAITAAAPSGIRPDFARLDTLEHALLGSNPDPKVLAQASDPNMIASLQRISDYLSQNCGIGG